MRFSRSFVSRVAALSVAVGWLAHGALRPALADTGAGLAAKRRVLLMAAPAAADPALKRQRDQVAAWPGAADRDVSIVEIAGDAVVGSGDAAASLRARYRLPADHFMAVLLGKDGHVALRSASPISAATLEATIDAMPMRRAGER